VPSTREPDARDSTRTVRDVVPGVHLITHGHTNCYVVEGEGGITLVDAAFPATWAVVRRCLAEVGRSAADVRGLVITHGHFDHVGFARLLQRSYGVPVWAARADAHILEHPYRYRPDRPRLTYPLVHPRSWPVLGAMVGAGALRVPGLTPDHLVDGRTILDLPGRPELVPAPGHTDGELVVHLPDHDAVLTGDALVTLDPYTGRRGPRLVARAATNDPRAALDSLTAIAALEVTAVLPGHGEPWLQGSRSAVDLARAAGVA
jgi:glyoxylase-like metal-dependent hydrolase (beta-lactamase superfamily II)